MVESKDEDAKTLDEIKAIIKEPEPKDIEEWAKISDDKKSLLIRIPARIRDTFSFKKGEFIRFFAEVKNGKVGELRITHEKEKK